MSVFSKNHSTAVSKGENVINEINALLSEMKVAKETGQLGGAQEDKLVSEINTLLSDMKGVKVSLTNDQVADLAMNGGKKKAAKKVAKNKTKTKSKTKTGSRSKKSRSMKREEGESKEAKPEGKDKKKRGLNPYMEKLFALRKYIMEELAGKEELKNVGALSGAASDLLKENDVDLAKAKKNFERVAFMKVYQTRKEAIEKKRADKKAMKA